MRSISPGFIALDIVTCLDLGMVWFCPLDMEAVAMLHPMAFKRVEGFFVGSISVVRRWNDALLGARFHWRMRMALSKMNLLAYLKDKKSFRLIKNWGSK